MDEKKLKWVILSISLILLPVPFIAPMAGIYFGSVAYILIAAFDYGYNAFGAIIFLHVIVYFLIFYFLITLSVRKYISKKSEHGN